MASWCPIVAWAVLVFIAGLFRTARAQTIGDLRLADGPAPNAGRVEFYLGFRGWYSTCDARWGIDDAMVVCRQLGFPGAALARTSDPYGGVVGVPLARDWECRGDEKRLKDCNYTPKQRCLETVGVVCQAPGYLGCYSDPSGSFNSRPGDDGFVARPTMTVAACLEHCRAGGASLAGLKNGRECHCRGRSAGAVRPDRRLADRQCQAPCAGNPVEVCGGTRSHQLRSASPGGSDRLSVFDLQLGQCAPPTQPANGRVLGEAYSYGDVIRFECAWGYRLANASSAAGATARCVMVPDGTGRAVGWDAPPPSCEVAVDSKTRKTQGDQFVGYETIERQYIFLSVLACLVVLLASAILFIIVKRRIARQRRAAELSSDRPPCYEDLVRDYERIADPKTGHYPVDRASCYQSLKPQQPAPKRPPRYAFRIDVPGHIGHPKEVWNK